MTIARSIRTVTYITVAKTLEVMGPSLPKSLASPLSTMIQQCSRDILPKVQKTGNDQACHNPRNGRRRNTSNTAISSLNADAYLGPRVSADLGLSKFSEELSDLHQSAWALLPLFITHLQPDYLELSVRAQIDRTAILAQHKAAMTASVLQPPRIENGRKALSSIMPHLARAFGQDTDIEGLIRPRMPIVNTPVYGAAAEKDLDISTEHDHEDQIHQDNEAESKVQPTEPQRHGQRERPPTIKENAQVALQQETWDQTRDPEEQIESHRKRPADDTIDHISQVPAGSRLHVGPSPPREDSSPTENSRPPKKPRLKTPEDTAMATATRSDERISARSQEQACAAAETASEPAPIPVNTRAEDRLSGPSEEQDQDSDDSFEIPELILDADTDEAEEEEDDDGDGG